MLNYKGLIGTLERMRVTDAQVEDRSTACSISI